MEQEILQSSLKKALIDILVNQGAARDAEPNAETSQQIINKWFYFINTALLERFAELNELKENIALVEERINTLNEEYYDTSKESSHLSEIICILKSRIQSAAQYNDELRKLFREIVEKFEFSRNTFSDSSGSYSPANETHDQLSPSSSTLQSPTILNATFTPPQTNLNRTFTPPRDNLNRTFTPPLTNLNRTVLSSPKSPSITGRSIDMPSVYYAPKSPLPAFIVDFDKTPPITKSVERKHQGMFTPRSVFEKDHITIRNLFGEGYESPEPPWGTGRIHYSDHEESAPVPEFDVPKREADVSMDWEIPQSDLNKTFTPPQGDLNRTFTPPQTSLDRTFTPPRDNLNRTFTPSQTNLNRAFSLPQSNLNRTFTPPQGDLNRTFTPPDSVLNKTFTPSPFEGYIKKSVVYNSPTRSSSLKVDIDVSPRPLIQTETGEQFACDISLKMEDSQPQQIGASYNPIYSGTLPIKRLDYRSPFSKSGLGQVYQTSTPEKDTPRNQTMADTPINLNKTVLLSPKSPSVTGRSIDMPSVYYAPKSPLPAFIVDYDKTPPITKSVERKHQGMFTPRSVFEKDHITIRNLFGDGYESPEPPWGTGRIHFSDHEESTPVPEFDVSKRGADISMAWEIPQSDFNKTFTPPQGDLNRTFTPPQSSLNRTVLLSPKSPSITGRSIDVPSIYYALKSPLPARIAYFNKTPPITKSVERKHQGMFTPRSVFEKDRIAIRNLFGDGYESPEPPWGTGRIHFSDHKESAAVPEFDLSKREADVSMAWEIPQSDLNKTFTPPQGDLNRTYTPPQTSLNRTFTPPQTNLNRAFSLPQDYLNRTFTPPGDNLNRTFTPPETNLNRTFSPPQSNLNRTFSPPQSNLNRTFSPPQSNLNRTFSPPQSNLNRTFSPPQSNLNRTFTPPQNNLNSTFSAQTPSPQLDRTYSPLRQSLYMDRGISPERDWMAQTQRLDNLLGSPNHQNLITASPKLDNVLPLEAEPLPSPGVDNLSIPAHALQRIENQQHDWMNQTQIFGSPERHLDSRPQLFDEGWLERVQQDGAEIIFAPGDDSSSGSGYSSSEYI